MKGKYFFIFGLILLIGFATAAHDLGDEKYSFSNTYGPNSTFSAWFNISFDENPLNSIISDSLGNLITLGDLLSTQINSGYDYECDRDGCASIYIASDPATEKSFSLNAGESILIGFEFAGGIESFNSAEFQILSDVLASCGNQLKIDLFNDGIIETGNVKKSTETCEGKIYSCFNQSEQQNEILLSSTPFCQRFTLEEAPGFNLGAWVKETKAGTNKVNMSLYDRFGNFLESCEIVKEDIKGIGEDVSCEVEYLITEPEDYYVCVLAGEGDGEYKTKGYLPSSDACGFFGIPVKPELNAYQIFVEKFKFDSIGLLTIEDDFNSEETFGKQIENYIVEEYGGLDCSNECLVPVKIISYVPQEITIKNLLINYDGIGLPQAEEKNFYDFEMDASKINSSFQKLFLDSANFSLPLEFGEYDYEIFYEGAKILDEKINIENISIDISPKIIPLLFETKILAEIEAPYGIEEYRWKFGDGIEIMTYTNSVTHSYVEKGTYTLILELRDSKNNIFSKSFNIEVNTSIEIIENAIENVRNDIQELELQMLDLDFFTRDVLKKHLELDETKSLLNSIETNLTTASTAEESQYILLLLDIDLPETFVKASTSKISYYPKKNSIDLDALEKIQNETYIRGNEENYKNALLLWYQENIETKIIMTEFSFIMEEGKIPSFKIFNLDISTKQDFLENSDVIIRDLTGLTFRMNHGEILIDGYQTFKLGEINQLQFSTTEDVAFQDLPFLISPRLSSLLGTPEPIIEEKKDLNPIIFYSLIVLLIISAIVAYFLIHRWYLNKYEDHLFPKKNNLYNMISYVNTSKGKDIHESEIKKNLKKSGWTSEQVNYVMKRYAGKKIGMPGLNKLNDKGNLNK